MEFLKTCDQKDYISETLLIASEKKINFDI